MHWLHDNWLTVLFAALYAASEIMPKLPNKAQTVVGAIIGAIKFFLASKGKTPSWTIEEPKATKDEEPK